MEAGYQVLKLKGGRDAPTDLHRLTLLRREVGPDVRIRLDANAGSLTYSGVALALRRAQDLGLDEFEQPLGRWDLRGMAQMCADLATPVIADESAFSADDVALCVADVINVKVQKAGGLYPALRQVAVTEASRTGVFIGAMQETGIGTAASLHLAATVHGLVTACDTRTHLGFEHTLLRNELAVSVGWGRVPTDPGLGIAVDEDALERYARGPWVAVAPARDGVLDDRQGGSGPAGEAR